MLGRNEKRVAGPPGGGAWTVVSNTTISNQATVDILLENATYTSYEVLLEDILVQTDESLIYLRYSTDAGSSFIASAYSFATTGISGAGSIEHQKSDSSSAIILASAGASSLQLGSGSGETFSAQIKIHNPGSASPTHSTFLYGYESAVPSYTHGTGAGYHSTAQNTDAIQFLADSGNLISGNIILLGLKV
jgi:hypothetical protein